MSMHPQRNLFKEFPNRVFVETGTYRGDGVRLAGEAGFEVKHSIDLTNEHNPVGDYELWNSTFLSIQFYIGDSSKDLWTIIRNINEPITFWLDAHWQMLEGEEPGPNPFPLLQELEQIKQHPIKTHSILIDDMLIMQPDIVGYSNQDVINKLLEINPDYHIEYFANPVQKGILVAWVE